ncbi:MAG: nicotinate (nicotinamide) nucleotide adenylyltransferase [Acidimicrobiales bacterium]|nr:nicotinate (nicotinamide) nucleotide adenylyltransferase [Acidimicrobiales bacterium]
MKIGIFGGTFDPIHKGHIACALFAKETLNLDLVYFVVAHDPWQKSVAGSQIAPAELRYSMVEAALVNIEGLFPSHVDIDRGGPSYSADTVISISHLHPDSDLYLIVGSDVAKDIGTWHRGEEASKNVKLVVVARKGTEVVMPGPIWDSMLIEDDNLPEISSTECRHFISEGSDISGIVPEEIIPILDANSVYYGNR